MLISSSSSSAAALLSSWVPSCLYPQQKGNWVVRIFFEHLNLRDKTGQQQPTAAADLFYIAICECLFLVNFTAHLLLNLLYYNLVGVVEFVEQLN
jgi:hypothetical protein